MRKIAWIQWGAFCAGVTLFTTACQLLDSGGPSMETIMQGGFKKDDALLKKINAGNATQADKDLYASYTEAMAGHTPPHGSAASWSEKTAALGKAARGVAGGGTDLTALKAATNCKNCHIVHKYAPGKSPY